MAAGRGTKQEPDARLLYATWGVAWSVGFGLMFAARSPSSPVDVPTGLAGAAFALLLAAAGVGADEGLLALLWSTGPGLVVGLLYVATGAMWSDRVQFALGAWILASSGAGALVGLPGAYLVMSLAGGGGFLLAAVVLAGRSRAARSL